MDSTAVWMASEQKLKVLGLSERGHIICLKNFYIPVNEKLRIGRKSLASAVTQGGTGKVNKKSIYKKKLGRLGGGVMIGKPEKVEVREMLVSRFRT